MQAFGGQVRRARRRWESCPTRPGQLRPGSTWRQRAWIEGLLISRDHLAPRGPGADPPRNPGRGRGSPRPSPGDGDRVTGVDPTPGAPGLGALAKQTSRGAPVVLGQHPLDRAQADLYLPLRHHLPDAGGEVTAQGQPPLGEQLAGAGDGDHQRLHPIGEAGGAAGSFGVGQAEALVGLTAAPLVHPRGTLTEPACRSRGPQVGPLVQEEGEAGPLDLGVRGGRRVGHPPGLVISASEKQGWRWGDGPPSVGSVA